MKKLIIVIAALCILFVGVIGFLPRDTKPAEVMADATAADAALSAAVQEAATVPNVEDAAAANPIRSLDYKTLYDLHNGDEVVMTVDGHEVTWDEYFYWLQYYGENVSYYMNMYAAYGMGFEWEDAIDESGTTYLEYVANMAEGGVKQMLTIERMAEQAGVELGAEELAAIADTIQSDKVSFVGEEATDEEFYAALAEQYLTPGMYERMVKSSFLYQAGFTALYGEDGGAVPDEDAIRWLEENSYISANHILLTTIDLSTGTALEDETVAAKKQQAEEISAELRAISDPDELLARFAELKQEVDEDSGKVTYPDGYTFTPGTMVTEFEDACNALEPYGVSEPVLSNYGYHVILKLPLRADAVVSYSNEGTALTARSNFANAAYGEALQTMYDGFELEPAAGFTVPNLSDYLIVPEA